MPRTYLPSSSNSAAPGKAGSHGGKMGCKGLRKASIVDIYAKCTEKSLQRSQVKQPWKNAISAVAKSTPEIALFRAPTHRSLVGFGAGMIFITCSVTPPDSDVRR
uniref:Uncharacterized protein n=1 Tax=Opuntia streptacantha TaxID=393608 RepID=A0A7C9DYG5_OPUST